MCVWKLHKDNSKRKEGVYEKEGENVGRLYSIKADNDENQGAMGAGAEEDVVSLGPHCPKHTESTHSQG